MTAIRDYFFPINPVTERREFHLIPTSVEKFVGANSYAPLIEKSGGEIKHNHKNLNYRDFYKIVQEVGAELAAHAKRKDIQFEFKLIDSDKDNAWCLPGGKIGINVGLIERMEKEVIPGSLAHTLREKIAAVLAHEIIHADARHTGRSLEFRLLLIGIIKAAQLFVVYHWVHRSYNAKLDEARKAQNASLITKLTAEKDQKAKTVGALFEALSSRLIEGISLCNSRSHELESDRYGMRMIRDVAQGTMYGYYNDSPKAAIWLQQYFKKHHSHDTGNHFFNRVTNLFSSHPSPEERLEANKQTWEDLKNGKL